MHDEHILEQLNVRQITDILLFLDTIVAENDICVDSWPDYGIKFLRWNYFVVILKCSICVAFSALLLLY